MHPGAQIMGGHVFASQALTSQLAIAGNDLGVLHALDQTSLADRLHLKRFDPGSQTWVDLTDEAWPYRPNSLGGWVSSSPALGYVVDGTDDMWLFVTARTASSGGPRGVLYCFGPQP